MYRACCQSLDCADAFIEDRGDIERDDAPARDEPHVCWRPEGATLSAQYSYPRESRDLAHILNTES